MGIIVDILKGIPLPSILKERIEALEAKYASLETELALKDGDLRKAQSENQKLQAEIVKLKEKIDSLTHIADLNETDIKILTFMARAGGSADRGTLFRGVGLHEVTFKNSITGLLSRKYIAETHLRRTPLVTGYKLAARGLKYADENNLMSEP